ncbi:MAG: alkaline phosphatase PhoX, partial [Pseudomonadota bacterium]
MKDHLDEFSFDDFDEKVNPKPETTEFDEVVERALSRRGFLGGVIAFGGVASIGGGLAPRAQAAAHASRFAFDAVAANTMDDVTVPPGYTVDVLVRWGDPIDPAGPEFNHETLGTAASQAITFGDNIDGMETFPIGERLALVVNNEYTNRSIIWGNRPDGKAASDDDVKKGMMAHGVTVVEVAEVDGDWKVVLGSPLNRRITPATEMEITGPAAGHDLLKTAADPTGTT